MQDLSSQLLQLKKATQMTENHSINRVVRILSTYLKTNNSFVEEMLLVKFSLQRLRDRMQCRRHSFVTLRTLPIKEPYQCSMTCASGTASQMCKELSGGGDCSLLLPRYSRLVRLHWGLIRGPSVPALCEWYASTIIQSQHVILRVLFANYFLKQTITAFLFSLLGVKKYTCATEFVLP